MASNSCIRVDNDLTSDISKANGFKALRTINQITDTEETETFCLNFDKFFDICNTRTIEEGERKRKPILKPFYVKEDQRLAK